MSKNVKVLVAVVLLAASLAACTVARAEPRTEMAAVPVIAPQNSESVAAYPRTITVVGLGKTSLTPDIGRINVGVQATASTVSEAKAEVDQQMAGIVAALKELGVAEKDIQTSHYSINYEREPYPPVTRGESSPEEGVYRVSSMLQVTVRDIGKVGDVLDGAVEAGANQVYGVTFTVSDERKWQSEARAAAVSDAKARASELAELVGVELGEVLTVSEVIGGSPVPMPMMAVERAMGGGGIAPGEMELSTQIQVTFAIQ